MMGTDGVRISRLTVMDRTNGTRYLVDTGADVSILPANGKGNIIADKYNLYAANNTLINTYGTKLVNLDLGLRRKFE